MTLSLEIEFYDSGLTYGDLKYKRSDLFLDKNATFSFLSTIPPCREMEFLRKTSCMLAEEEIGFLLPPMQKTFSHRSGRSATKESFADSFFRTVPIFGNYLLDQDTYKLNENQKALHEDTVVMKKRFEERFNDTYFRIKSLTDSFNADIRDIQLQSFLQLQDKEKFDHAIKILESLLDIRHGVISPFLFSPRRVADLLYAIRSKLGKKEKLAINNNEDFYEFSSQLEENKTHYKISIHVPISSSRPWTSLEVFSPLVLIHELPAKIRFPAVIFQSNKQESSLNKDDWASCKKGKTNFCKASMHSQHDHTCAHDLLKNKTLLKIERVCNIKFEEKKNQVYTTPNQIYVYHQNKDILSVHCSSAEPLLFYFQGIKILNRTSCFLKGSNYHLDQSYSTTNIPLSITFPNITGGKEEEVLNWIKAHHLDLPLADLSNLRLHDFSKDSFTRTKPGKILSDAASGLEYAADWITNTTHMVVIGLGSLLALVLLAGAICLVRFLKGQPSVRDVLLEASSNK